LCLTIGVLSRLLSYFEILESLKQGNVFLEMKSAFEMCLIGTFMRTDSIQNLKTIYTYPKK